MKNHSQRSKITSEKFKNSMSIWVLTRSVEIFAVLFSLFWGVEAIAANNHTSTEFVHGPSSRHIGRSLSSLAIPGSKSSATVEFLQYSRLNKILQTKYQPNLNLVNAPEYTALSFRQNPYFAQSQFEFIRFPTMK
jgi:hypothetical protein